MLGKTDLGRLPEKYRLWELTRKASQMKRRLLFHTRKVSFLLTGSRLGYTLLKRSDVMCDVHRCRLRVSWPLNGPSLKGRKRFSLEHRFPSQEDRISEGQVTEPLSSLSALPYIF